MCNLCEDATNVFARVSSKNVAKYECRHCGSYTRLTKPNFVLNWVDKYDSRPEFCNFFVLPFPLPEISHVWECGTKQGSYWPDETALAEFKEKMKKATEPESEPEA